MLSLDRFRNHWFQHLARVALGTFADGHLDPLGPLYDLDDVAVLVLLSFFAGYGSERQVNHVLLEGINGLSKTRLAGQVNAALIGPTLRAYYDLTGADPYQRTAGSPDQAPADVLGGDVLGGEEQGRGRRLVFQRGPLLRRCFVYYADELNRSPPKTQSVLLEAMAERQVTLNTLDARWQRRRIQRLPWFWLLASQNPEFHEGTFPLPEAQLDRFMVKIIMPYTTRLADLLNPRDGAHPAPPPPRRGPDVESLKETLKKELKRDPDQWERFCQRLGGLKPTPAHVAEVCALRREGKAPPAPVGPDGKPDLHRALTAERIETALQDVRQETLDEKKRQAAWNVGFPPRAAEYAARLVYATWSQEAAGLLARGIASRVSQAQEVRALVADVAQGCSPRAALALRDLSCALAWAQAPEGHPAVVTEEHIDAVAPHVLQHRLALRFQSLLAGGQSPDRLIEQLVKVFRWQR
jgi:MoxR-like ATPase